MDDGAFVSHFVCGMDQATCWTGMTTAIVPPGGASDPAGATVYEVLRRADGSCPMTSCMPALPMSAFFEPSDLARIAAWIQNGAQND
jgi:hypothetical protein